MNPPSLKKLALRGASYEILFLVLRYGLRFGSNLILTRLLYPEAFGLAAFVIVIMQALVMLSDVGIAPGIVQSPRGNDPDYLDTAWTLQVIRGAILAVAAGVLAWPVAWFYEKPDLAPLVLLSSLGLVANGASSTSLHTLRRRVDAKRAGMVEIVAHVVGIVAILPIAWVTRSAWSLVLSPVIVGTARALLSHFAVNVGHRNRFFWSKDAARDITHFGRWIFLASTVQFFAAQLDRMMLAKFLGFSELGLFTVAAALVELGNLVIERLGSQVAFPVLSRVHRDTPERLAHVYHRMHLSMSAVVMPLTGVAIVLAPWVIDVLYDDRYVQAGWMLQILLVQVAVHSITTPSWTCLFAMGHSRVVFGKSALRLAWMLVAGPVAFHFWHLPGLLWATALSELPTVGMVLPALARRQLLSVRLELLAFSFLGVGYGLARLVQLALQ